METPFIKNLCMAGSLFFLILICGCRVETDTTSSNAPEGIISKDNSTSSGRGQVTGTTVVESEPDLPVSSESEVAPNPQPQASTPSGPTVEDLAINTTTPLLEATTTGSATPAPAVSAAATPVVEASLPLQNISIQPSTITQNEETSLTITGNHLSGSKVEFRRNKEETTYPEIIADSGNELIIMRTVNEAPLTGNWDVVVILPDGSTSELPGGLEIQEPSVEAPAVETPSEDAPVS